MDGRFCTRSARRECRYVAHSGGASGSSRARIRKHGESARIGPPRPHAPHLRIDACPPCGLQTTGNRRASVPVQGANLARRRLRREIHVEAQNPLPGCVSPRVVTAAMYIGAASPPVAADPGDETSALEVIEAATPGADHAAVLTAQESTSTEEYVSHVPLMDTVITIPMDASAGVLLDQGSDVVDDWTSQRSRSIGWRC